MPPTLPDLDAFRLALFRIAKWRWQTGFVISLVAVFVVPASAVGLPIANWLAVVLASVLSLVGLLLRMWGDSVRAGAEQLLRGNDLAVGIGRDIDRRLLADLTSKYSRVRKFKQRPMAGEDCARYFAQTGNPSSKTLISNMRESAWWTAKLARSAGHTVWFVVASLFAITVLLLVIDSSVIRASGCAVCLALLASIGQVAWDYSVLERDCERIFADLDRLQGDSRLATADALLAATEYQRIRAAGPPIPDWLWRYRRAALRQAWKEIDENSDQ